MNDLSFELWDDTTGNIIGNFTSLEDAIHVARELVKVNGVVILQDLILVVHKGEDLEPLATLSFEVL